MKTIDDNYVGPISSQCSIGMSYPDSLLTKFAFMPTPHRKNPHNIIPATALDKAELKNRMNVLHIPQFDAEIGKEQDQDEETLYPGYPKAVAYTREPQNRYQRWLREGTGDEVEGHYTRRFGAAIIER